MSDVSAGEVIAGVLERHEYSGADRGFLGNEDLEHCICGWQGTGESVHTQHVATEVDKALGGLARERKPVNQKNRAKPCGNCGHLKGVHAEPCVILVRDGLGVHECGCPEHTYTEPVTEWVGRWIGGWTPEEAS